jgi:ABC-2 type transport system permease protein
MSERATQAVAGSGFEGRGSLHRHLRLVAVQLRIRVLAALEYRAGFWTGGVLSLLWSMGGVVPLVVALDHRPDVVGWGPWSLAMLVGCHMIVNGLFGALVQPALFAAMEDIRTGALDYLLLRPVSALVSCLVADFQPWSLLETLVGVGLLVLAATEVGVSPSALHVVVFVVVLGSGIAALYAIAVLILTFAFRAMQLQNASSAARRLALAMVPTTSPPQRGQTLRPGVSGPPHLGSEQRRSRNRRPRPRPARPRPTAMTAMLLMPTPWSGDMRERTPPSMRAPMNSTRPRRGAMLRSTRNTGLPVFMPATPRSSSRRASGSASGFAGSGAVSAAREGGAGQCSRAGTPSWTAIGGSMRSIAA